MLLIDAIKEGKKKDRMVFGDGGFPVEASGEIAIKDLFNDGDYFLSGGFSFDGKRIEDDFKVEQKDPCLRSFKVKDGCEARGGRMIMLSKHSGLAEEAAPEGGVVAGVSVAMDGAPHDFVAVKTGCFRFKNSKERPVRISDIEDFCFVEDSLTVRARGADDGILAGRVFDVDDTGVWVKVGY